MVRFEYLVKYHDATKDLFVEFLNRYGGEGWEAILIEDEGIGKKVVFKRKIV